MCEVKRLGPVLQRKVVKKGWFGNGTIYSHGDELCGV